MTTFPSSNPGRRLDGLQDVAGFNRATAGIAYSFLKDTPGGVYKPIPTLEAGSCVDPAGGIEKNTGGCLKIKPDTTTDSGVGLSTDGLEIIGRVKKTGDTMSGSLKIVDDTMPDPAGQYALQVRKGDGLDGPNGRGILAHGGTPASFQILEGRTWDDERRCRLTIGLAGMQIRTNDEAAGTASAVQMTIPFSTSDAIIVHANRISGLSTPLVNDDAATKQYVDDTTEALDDSRLAGNPPVPWDGTVPDTSGLYRDLPLGSTLSPYTGFHMFQLTTPQTMVVGVTVTPGPRIVNSGYGMSSFGSTFILNVGLIYKLTAQLRRSMGTATYSWFDDSTGNIFGSIGGFSSDGGTPAIAFVADNTINEVGVKTVTASGSPDAESTLFLIEVVGAFLPGFFPTPSFP